MNSSEEKLVMGRLREFEGYLDRHANNPRQEAGLD